jgi:DNA-binding NarL/FixJ family response regulator
MNAAAASPLTNAPVKVLLADDEGLVRSGFKLLLDVEDDITVVGEATNGAEAVERARATRPDVVLMDIRMPKLDGIQATTHIAATHGLEQVRVLILTTYDTDEYVFDALQAGASGFLLKDAGPAELLHAIRVIAAGDALLAPRITRRLISQFTAQRTATQAAENRLAVLTERERQVLALVGQGLSNDEIGTELILSPATARTHVSHAMAKLGARDRAQLVVIAYQTGLAGQPQEDPAAVARRGPTRAATRQTQTRR